MIRAWITGYAEVIPGDLICAITSCLPTNRPESARTLGIMNGRMELDTVNAPSTVTETQSFRLGARSKGRRLQPCV